MDIVFLLLKQNLVMILYMLIGYALYHAKLVSNTGSKELGKILL